MNELEKTKQWFEQAIPEPTIEQACVQVGCHYEEVSEMMLSLVDSPASDVEKLAAEYKELSIEHMPFLSTITDSNKVELFDAMLDQIVTAVGVCHMLKFDVMAGLAEVNRSNFSKFEDGIAVFDENGKIKKGEHYTSPELKRFI